MTMEKLTHEPSEGKLNIEGTAEPSPGVAVPMIAHQMDAHDRRVALAAAREITPAQARIEAVASVLHAAYSKASTLTLSADEIKRLAAAFPDEAFRSGAGGKDNLIYIQHAFLRQRLCEVIGIGQWSLVQRSRWTEEFMTTGKTPQQAIRVYVDAVLLVRGCYVSEAIGDMVYYPKNEATNFGDAAEGAESAALRRCAKHLGVGLQQWDKNFCDGWLQRMRSTGNGGSWEQQAAQAPAASPAPSASPRVVLDGDGTLSVETTRLILDGLTAQGLAYADAHRWFLANQWLRESQQVRMLSTGHAQRILDSLPVFCAHVKAWAAGNPSGAGAAKSPQASQPSQGGES
jgi:hypothetical protein